MSQSIPPLAANHSKILTISAQLQWNPSQILLEAGQAYRFEMLHVTRWKDGGIDQIDPTQGFTRWYLSPFNWLRRYPQANWFVLIGAIGENPSTFFPINQPVMEYTATATGEFRCFANDAPFAYGNNVGTLTLKVTHL